MTKIAFDANVIFTFSMSCSFLRLSAGRVIRTTTNADKIKPN